MTRIKIKILIWDDWNIEHIKKHNVEKVEVEYIALNFTYHERSYGDRYLVVGKSNKRTLSIVVKRVSSTTYYLVTARDASKKERKKLYEKEN